MRAQNATGFDVSMTGVSSPQFYADPIHPNGAVGHRVIAELNLHFILGEQGVRHQSTHRYRSNRGDAEPSMLSSQPSGSEAIKDLLINPLGLEDLEQRDALLPRPMFPGNYEPSGDTCWFNG